jgi:predicted nucleic acid-binding protein
MLCSPMSAERDLRQDNLPEETRINEEISDVDFDVWASQVRRQMMASLKRRTFVYGDFWGNNARANQAKAAQEKAPDAEQ